MILRKFESITQLRLWPIIGVVFLHAKMTNTYSIDGIKYTMPEVKLCSFIVNYISSVLAHSCVPLFFLFLAIYFSKV